MLTAEEAAKITKEAQRQSDLDTATKADAQLDRIFTEIKRKAEVGCSNLILTNRWHGWIDCQPTTSLFTAIHGRLNALGYCCKYSAERDRNGVLAHAELSISWDTP